jgi:hypothetical protein
VSSTPTGTTTSKTTAAAPKPGTTGTPADTGMSGSPSIEVVTVESDEKNAAGLPMTGVYAVAVQVGCDGFGNWRALNLGGDAPAFKTRDECVNWVTSVGIPGGTVVTDA